MSIYNLAKNEHLLIPLNDLTDNEKILLLKHNQKLKNFIQDYISKNNYTNNINKISEDLINEIFIDEWKEILTEYTNTDWFTDFKVDEDFNIYSYETFAKKL